MRIRLSVRAATMAVFLCYVAQACCQSDNMVDAINDSHDRLSNVSVIYTIESAHTPPAYAQTPEFLQSLQKDGETIRLVSGSSTARCEFRRAGQLALFSRTLISSSNTSLPPDLEPFILSFSSSRYEQRHGQTGLIGNEHPLPVDFIVDIALGLRIDSAPEWLPRSFWTTCTIEGSENSKLILSRERGIRNLEVKDVWAFDPQYNLALVEYRVQHRSHETEPWATSLGIVNSDFRDVDGLKLPHHIEASLYSHTPDGGPTVTAHHVLQVDAYSLGTLRETEEEFLIPWPDGAVVRDTRVDQQYVVRDGPLQLTDKTISAVFGATALTSEEASPGWPILLTVSAILLLLVMLLMRRRSMSPQ